MSYESGPIPTLFTDAGTSCTTTASVGDLLCPDRSYPDWFPIVEV